MMKKEPQKRKNISLAICLSLMIHLALGAALVIGLSHELKLVPGWNKQTLVWVNIDNGKNGSASTRNHQVTTSSEMVKETHPAEKSLIKPGQEAAGTFVLSVQSPPIITVGRNINGMTTNIAASATQTGGNLSLQDSGTAYPLYRENMPPAYPEIARMRGYEGIVLLAAEILADGRVGSMKIKKSSGYAVLDQSAVDSIKPWKFEPARKSGKPFTVWVELPVKFVLNDNNQS
jgi:TonB family protein